MKGNFSEVVKKDLMQSSLEVADAHDAGWYELRPPNIRKQLKEILGFSRFDGINLAKSCTDFLVISYPRKDFCRIKLYPSVNGVKYLQPKGVSVEPYIPEAVWELRHRPTQPLIITEGEKKVLCLLKHSYNAIGLPGVWCFRNNDGGLLGDLQEFYWKDRITYIAFDSDAVFNKQVLQAEIELALRLWKEGAKVYIVRLPQNTHGDKMGIDDFVAANGVEALRNIFFNEAKPFQSAYPIESIDLLASSVAKLYVTDIVFAPHVKTLAKQIRKHTRGAITQGDFLSTVDAFVDKYADKTRREKQAENQIVETIEPFDGEVDGIELAELIETALRKHVKISPADCYSAIMLWVLLTYVYEQFPICPMLLIVSPTKRCGKTTLIETLEGLVNRALVVSNITPAAAFRTIEKHKPTLLADEADAGLKDNEDLRGIFNAGHTRRTAYVIRAGDKSNGFDPVRFNVFCPKAIASIRRLPDTWEDRGIKISMQRKAVENRVKPLGLDFFDRHRELRQKLLTWAAQTAETLDPNVDTPKIANDRARDNWKPLLAIAQALGAEWFQKAQQAMLTLERGKTGDDLRIELLRDIKQIFDEMVDDKVASQQLTEMLNNLTDRPWADFSHGKGLTVDKRQEVSRNQGFKSSQVRYQGALQGSRSFLKTQILLEVPFREKHRLGFRFG